MDIVDVTERLMAEFENQFGLDLITRVVTQCRQDLRGAPTGALPELLERAARQRRLTMLDSPPLKNPNPRVPGLRGHRRGRPDRGSKGTNLCRSEGLP